MSRLHHYNNQTWCVLCSKRVDTGPLGSIIYYIDRQTDRQMHIYSSISMHQNIVEKFIIFCNVIKNTQKIIYSSFITHQLNYFKPFIFLILMILAYRIQKSMSLSDCLKHGFLIQKTSIALYCCYWSTLLYQVQSQHSHLPRDFRALYASVG